MDNIIEEELEKDKDKAKLMIEKRLWDIEDIDTEIRKDIEIHNLFWKCVSNYSKEYSLSMCSVISIDEYGNKIISDFIENEIKRHLYIRNRITEQNTEFCQFIKFENGKFDKKIFDVKYKPFIVLIGKKKNDLSDIITKKYRLKERINIVEIYETDIDIDNIKLITSDKEKIFDLLRIVTYNYSFYSLDSVLTNERDEFNEALEKFDCTNYKNKNLNIIKFKVKDPNELELYNYIREDKEYLVDIIFNYQKHHILECLANIGSKFPEFTRLHITTHITCNFDWIELIFIEI